MHTVRLHFRQTPTYGTVSYGSVGNVTTLQTSLLTELEPVVAANLDRHLSLAKDWQPQDYVPWSRGRDFAFLGGTDWQPEDSPLDPVAQTAMIVNLLTEDNLPSYHREIATRFGRDGAWGRGSVAGRPRRAGTRSRYATTWSSRAPWTRSGWSALRMEHMTAGYDSGDTTMLHSLAYVSFQELATRIAHRNTGRATGCPLAEQLLARISADENLHMVFYRNLMSAALELAPDEAMQTIRDEVVGFQMPGQGMTDYAKQRHHHRQGRHLRPAPAPRRGDPARAAVLADLRAHRLWPGRRARPRRALVLPRDARRQGEAL